jgi:hypothetical protein
MLTRTLSIAFMTTLVVVGADAETDGRKGVLLSKDGTRTIAEEPAAAPSVPYSDEDATLETIFDNLGGAYPLGAYWCCSGATISGHFSEIETEFWAAAAFTPTVSLRATAIKLAVGYVSGNATHLTLSLNADAGGVPGAALRSWDVSNLPNFRRCCAVVTKKDSAGIPVKAGTQYWVVLSTENDSDVYAVWNLNDTDQVNRIPTAYASDGAWTSQMGTGFAFSVLGR